MPDRPYRSLADSFTIRKRSSHRLRTRLICHGPADHLAVALGGQGELVTKDTRRTRIGSALRVMDWLPLRLLHVTCGLDLR